MKIVNKNLGIIFIICVWLAFSFPFFTKNLVPYPSLYQSNFFAPWSAYHIYDGAVKNNAMPDIITQIYPWRVFTIQSLKSLQIPLWNPYSFAGTPHLANYQSAPLFPLNILFFLPISFIDSWSILVLMQPLLAAIFMYIFLKSFKLNEYAVTIGAISFMFCGFITTWMGYATLGYAILFLPLALFLVNKFSENSQFIYGLLLTLTIPLSFFAGHFQTSVYFIGAILLYIILNYFLYKKRIVLILLLLFLLSGILISLPQIIPSVELYFNSVREEIVAQIEVIPLGYLPSLFAPDYFGNPVTRNDWFGHYAEWNGYAGAVAILFTIFALIFNFKNKKIWYFVLLLIVSLLLAFDTPINYLLFQLKLPLLSTSASSRIIVLFSFSIAALSAFGVDYLIKNLKSLSVKKMIIFFASAILIFSILWTIPFLKLLPDSEKNLIAQKNLILPSLTFLILFGLVILLYIFRNKRKVKSVVLIGLLLLVAFDMYRFSSKWMPFDPKGFVFKDVGISGFYNENKPNERYLGDFSAENSVYYKLQSPGGYDPLYPERYGEFVKYVANGKAEPGDRSVVSFPMNGMHTDKAIDFLGVSYIPIKKSDENQPWAFPINNYPVDRFNLVYEDEAYKIFRNNNSFPRAYIVGNYEVGTSDEEILDLMFNENTNLRSMVIVEENPKVDRTSSASADVDIESYKNNEVIINTDSSNAGLLVLTDNYYPGWKAYVNGNQSKIYRANYSFRAVEIPEGKSQIKFEYSPESFKYGTHLVIIGFIIITSLFLFKLNYERKN